MPRHHEQQLKPEYFRAGTVLERNLDRALVQNPFQISREILNTNSFQIFSGPVATRLIPCGHYWRWNQTKAKQRVTLHNRRIVVTICKLIPRRKGKPGSQCDFPLPSVKMWKYEIKKDGNLPPLVAMWCEYGIDYKKIAKKEEPPGDSFPEIGELVFLSDFMPLATAIEIWPELCNKAKK